MKARIAAEIKKVITESVRIEITVPENKQFGHYATSVAMKLAKIRNQPPLVIAEEIKNAIRKNARNNFFAKIEIAPPGFINFWLAPKLLQNEVKEILKKKEKYGKGESRTLRQAQGKKIQLEYISANPTGPLTLANGRGGFFGDVLANLLEYQGQKIEREYYVNDTGNQIITLGKSLAATQGFIPDEEKLYKGEYIKKWAAAHKVITKQYKDTPLLLGQKAAKDFLKATKKVIAQKAKIKFDRYTSEEAHIHKKSFITKTLAIFKKEGMVYEREGATWLKTTAHGDDKDRVLITRDGFPTYFLADAGHYLETKTRGFTKKILILGPDHYGYVHRIQAAARIIGIQEPEVIVTQAVRLMQGGTEVKMSKRSGMFVTLEELLNEISPDVVRFFFLMHSPETHMDFNMDLAKEHSVKNPVYYIQYAAVRAASILRKAKYRASNSKYQALNTEADIDLISVLVRFPEIISEATEKYNPQLLARYALDCAREFNNFYEKERIIPARRSPREGGGEEKNIMAARLALVHATHTVLKTALNLLGITLPKKM